MILIPIHYHVLLHAARLTEAQGHLERRIKDDHNLLRDFKRSIVKIDESVFTYANNPINLLKEKEDSLSERHAAIRRLWRIRRFLRDQLGLSSEALAPPPAHDPKGKTALPPYDPTQQTHSRSPSPARAASPSFSRHDSLDYDEMSD
jgi:hypothetical protein